MINKLRIFFLTALFCAQAHANSKFVDLKDIYLKWDYRYDNKYGGIDSNLQNVKNALDHRIRLGFVVDLFGNVELIGFASTGDSFGSTYLNGYNFKEKNQNPPSDFYFRRLYLQKVYKNLKVQLGSIKPVKNRVSGTGLDKNGWIDGGRVEIQTLYGLLEVVSGSIYDLDNPNFSSRKKVLNFFEVEFTSELFENFILEASYEKLASKDYLRAEVTMDLQSIVNKALSFTIESLYNVDDNAFSTGVSIDLDLFGMISQKLEEKTNFRAAYYYLNPDIGLRGELADDYYTQGNSVIFELDGVLSKEKKVNWFLKYSITDIYRLTFGIKLSF